MTTSSATHDTFVIVRKYEAPVSSVFQAFADPERKARWFAGSVDSLNNGYQLDFTVGGHEFNRGGPPGGPVFTYDAQFRDIVVNQRIVYTYELYADEARMSVSVTTVEFHQSAGATELVLTEQGVFLDGHDTAAQREEGTRGFLESLAAALESDPS